MTQSRWMIIGLGWLGNALQQRLLAQGVSAVGTHRSEFDFLVNDLQEVDCDVLFLNTPPLVEMRPSEYAKKIQAARAKKIIFISSTSVYGMSCGEVNEESTPTPDSPGGKWLWAIESELRSRFQERLVIVRPGGLIGGERHPVYHLQGRTNIKGGNELVNLIDREDLINIILTIPDSILLLNAIAPFHPRKDEYYPQMASKFGLASPCFEMSSHGDRLIKSLVLDSFYPNWVRPLLGL